MGLLSIGVSGLTSYQSALQTTGNNISNASVEGYSRQRVEIGTKAEQLSGAGYLGAGSVVEGITRIVDQFAVKQLRLDTASFFGFNAFGNNIEQLDTLLADEFSSLSPALANFFTALEGGAEDPTSIPARQLVVSNAEGLVQQMNTLSDRIAGQITAVNDRLASLSAGATGLAEGIANLNVSIETAMAAGDGSQPNQLLDEREKLLKELSSMIEIQVVTDVGGAVNVFVGSGQPLVIGANAGSLQTRPSSIDASVSEVVFVEAGSGIVQPLNNHSGGGEINGLLRYRTEVVSEALNTLGRLAISLAGELNAQQADGLDAEGNFGTNIFTDINNWSIASDRVIENSNNTGALASLYFDDLSQVTTSDYSLRVTAETSGVPTSFVLVRDADNQTWTEADFAVTLQTVTIGEPPVATANVPVIQTPDGFSINLESAAYAVGDSFTIRPTRSGSGDMNLEIGRPQELAFASAIVTGANIALNRGTGTISPGEVIDTSQMEFVRVPAALTQPIEISFAAGAISVTGPGGTPTITQSNATAFVPGQVNTLTFNGGQFRLETQPVTSVAGDAYRIELNGSPRDGDSFSINFNSSGISDSRNAVAMGALRINGTMDNGAMNFEEAYSRLVEGVGVQTAQARISASAAESLMIQSQATRDSTSGVNLDEEAANLIKFEQAYSAAAQVINVARQIFDTLMSAMR